MRPQLTLDGREVAGRLVPPRLSDRQRELLRYVRERGEVRPTEIGALMHAGRDAPPKPDYYSSDGCRALGRLMRRGLVQKVAHGRYVAARHTELWTEPPPVARIGPCPHCDRGSWNGPNGARWRCSYCNGTGRLHL